MRYKDFYTGMIDDSKLKISGVDRENEPTGSKSGCSNEKSFYTESSRLGASALVCEWFYKTLFSFDSEHPS